MMAAPVATEPTEDRHRTQTIPMNFRRATEDTEKTEDEATEHTDHTDNLQNGKLRRRRWKWPECAVD
jgi:hypothetical protein